MVNQRKKINQTKQIVGHHLIEILLRSLMSCTSSCTCTCTCMLLIILRHYFIKVIHDSTCLVDNSSTSKSISVKKNGKLNVQYDLLHAHNKPSTKPCASYDSLYSSSLLSSPSSSSLEADIPTPSS